MAEPLQATRAAVYDSDSFFNYIFFGRLNGPDQDAKRPASQVQFTTGPLRKISLQNTRGIIFTGRGLYSSHTSMAQV